MAIGQQLQVVDNRPDPKPIKPLPKSCQHLFKFQREAVDTILEKRNGIIKLPTGAGKTEIGIAIACRVNTKTLWLVDEKGLAKQAMDRWYKITGRPAGLIGDNTVFIGQFTVAMLQSIRSRLQRSDEMVKAYLKRVGCVIVDECHIAAAKSYYKTIISIPKAVYRIGLSATPTGRSDKKDAYVVGALGPVRYKAKIDQLVELGRLAKAMVIFYRYPGATFLGDEPMKWHILYEQAIVREEARNRAIIRICKVTPKPTLVFFERKRHGFALLDALQQEGFNVEIVYGAHSGTDRMKLAGKLNRGELDVLLASRVFNKGIDIPEIRSAVNAAGYKAVITSMQKMGRPMRASEVSGKDQFVYWDMIDGHHDTLLQHSRDRSRTYRREGLAVLATDSLADAMEKLVQIGLVNRRGELIGVKAPPALEWPRAEGKTLNMGELRYAGDGSVLFSEIGGTSGRMGR